MEIQTQETFFQQFCFSQLRDDTIQEIPSNKPFSFNTATELF